MHQPMFFRRTEHKIRIGMHYVSDWHYLLTLNQILYLKIFSICNVSWKSLLRNNKLASLEATLVRNYYRLTHWLTGVKCRATSVAKNQSQCSGLARQNQGKAIWEEREVFTFSNWRSPGTAAKSLFFWRTKLDTMALIIMMSSLSQQYFAWYFDWLQ